MFKKGASANESTDIYALGVTMMELWTRRTPYWELTEECQTPLDEILRDRGPAEGRFFVPGGRAPGARGRVRRRESDGGGRTPPVRRARGCGPGEHLGREALRKEGAFRNRCPG